MEIWKPIPGFEGKYSVSNFGRILSHARIVTMQVGESTGKRRIKPHSKTRAYKDRFLPPNGSEYPIVTLVPSSGNKLAHFRLHRLVAMVFIGPKPEGLEICHIDGNPKNNRVDNLRYDTREANLKDAMAHKLARGFSQRSRLKYSDILEIRNNSNDLSSAQLAVNFGVSTTTIYRIVQKKMYKFLV